MRGPAKGGDETLMRDTAELMTDWISKQGDDGVDDVGLVEFRGARSF